MIPHQVTVQHSGDNIHAPRGYRAHCAFCRDWWTRTLASEHATRRAADYHRTNGRWP